MPNVTTFLDTRIVPPGRIALVCPSRGGETFTYDRLRSEMNRIAAGLRAAGVKKGDRVCIYLDSSPEYLISYLAIWRIGAIAVPTNIVYRGDELLHAVNDASAAFMITEKNAEALVEGMRSRAHSPMTVITVGGSAAGNTAWESIPPVPSSLDAADCLPTDLCHIQYTAGTTGKPKGAMLSHGNWMAALEAEREALRLVPDDVYLGIYPMGHVGLSWGISVLRAGGKFVMMERFALDRYLELAEKYRATVLAGMPPVLHSLVTSPPGTEKSLGTARLIISGGGQLLPSVWEAFGNRFGIPVANAYGLSETIVIGSGTLTLPDRPELTCGYRSVGIPVGYAEVRIVDTSDPALVLPPGQEGEIALRGPAVASGYWGRPDESARAFLKEGWFLTGDIGFLDDYGVLFITDRKKDMIVMSGWKIYPTEVENILVQHPEVSDAAVFGCPDNHRGEIPVAAIVRKKGTDPDPSGILDFCRERLAGYKVPRDIIFRETLPRVHGWKLLRRTLREELCGEVLPDKAYKDR